MMKLTRTAVVLLAVSLCAPVSAVNTLLGFRFPLGVPATPASGMGVTMGGAMTGVAADNNIMLGNPANLGNLSKTVFSLYANLDINTISSVATDSSSTSMGFAPQQISVGLPMGSFGTIGVSYQKRADLSAHFNTTDYPPIQFTGLLDSVTSQYVRDGGQVSWMGGWGYSVGKWAQLGVTYQRQFLLIRSQNRITNFESGYREISTDSSATSMAVNGLGLGVMLPLFNLLPSVNATVGLSGEYFFSATAKHAELLTARSSIPLYQNTASATVKLPPTMRQGVSWVPTPELLTALDVHETFWSKYDGAGVLLATDRTTALGVNLGLQYIPSPNLLMPRYWEIIRYRAGFRYDQLPVKSASEWGVGLGFGLPLPEGNGVIDLNVEYTRRSDSQWGNYREDIVKIGFGLNGGRKWTKASQGDY